MFVEQHSIAGTFKPEASDDDGEPVGGRGIVAVQDQVATWPGHSSTWEPGILGFEGSPRAVAFLPHAVASRSITAGQRSGWP